VPGPDFTNRTLFRGGIIGRPFPVALLIALAAGIAIGVAVTAIAAAQAPPAAATAEVRITARLLENGKVEFGLQQREGDGWGARQLPRVRYFPADADVGRWLNSSPVTVTAPARGAATAPQPGTAGDTGAWERIGYADGVRVGWHLSGAGKYAAGGRSGVTYNARPLLRLSCAGGGLFVDLVAEEGVPLPEQRRRAPGIPLTDVITGYTEAWPGRGWGWQAYYVERVSPTVGIANDSISRAWLDWLEESYAHSPIVRLQAIRDEGAPTWESVIQFSGRFDLTGLPAVLADLPCYE